MKAPTRAYLACLVIGLSLAIASSSFGQRVQPVPLRENPYRDIGGSCIYGRDGKAVYAPAGVHCPDNTRRDVRAPAAKAGTTDKYPPAMRGELDRLLDDHEHLSREIAELRRAIEGRKQEAALEALDHITTKLRDHLLREERFLEGERG